MGEMTMDEFLGHSTRGGRGKVMKSWKKDGELRVWLNRKSSIHCVWRHNFKRVAQLKDKPPEIWGEKFRCFEVDEDILRNYYRRDRDKRRTHPPEACGYCRFLEDLYQHVLAGDISWTDKAFEFEAGRKSEVMHVGGLLGLFGSRNLDDDQKQELKDHEIYPREAWKEDSRPKAEYIFCVVNDKDPRSGVQVTIETASVGDKMKRCIADQMKARKEKGNPMLNPYPFLWEFDDRDDVAFDDKYNVVPLIEDRPTPEILKLIDGPGPDVTGIVEGQSPDLIRTMLEQACVLDVDWDDYFPKGKPAPKAERTPDVSSTPKDEPAPPPEPEPEDLVACDGCDKPMSASATKCGNCGRTYDVTPADPQPPLPPAPAPLPKRSASTASKPPAAAPAKPAASSQVLDPALFGGEGDDIPF